MTCSERAAALAEDLSQYHAPLTRLFPAPATPAGWERYRLTDGQVAFYEEHGYLAGVRVFDGGQVGRLRAEPSELLNPGHPARGLWYEFHSNESNDPGRVLFHALGAWRIAEGFHDLLWNPRFTVPASQLLGGAVRFWHDQLFCKPARHGGVVAWHRDYSYWTRTTPLAHLTCWAGLDARERLRPLRAGSHRWPDLPRTGLAGDMDAILSVLTGEQRRQFKPVAIELKAGEASFHHPRMLHGSYANATERPRRATVVNVLERGTESHTPSVPRSAFRLPRSEQLLAVLFSFGRELYFRIRSRARRAPLAEQTSETGEGKDPGRFGDRTRLGRIALYRLRPEAAHGTKNRGPRTVTS